jgi:hypothetical protein
MEQNPLQSGIKFLGNVISKSPDEGMLMEQGHEVREELRHLCATPYI